MWRYGEHDLTTAEQGCSTARRLQLTPEPERRAGNTRFRMRFFRL
jgi:hypothetical protein